MTYMIQQRPQQISTESLACQKKKSVADNFSRCEASSFFFPIFVFHSTDSTKSTVETVSDITTTITDGVTEAAIMYGGGQAVPRYVSYASVVRSPLPPLTTKTETQNDNQSKIQQKSGQDHRLYTQSQESGARSHCPWSEQLYRYWHTHRRFQSPVRTAPVTQSESRTYSYLISCQ